MLVFVLELARRHYHAYRFRFTLESRYLRGFLWSPLCLAGLIAFTVYLGHRFDDPLAFLHGQRAWATSLGGARIYDLLGGRYISLVGTTIARFDLLHPDVIGQVVFMVTPVLWFAPQSFEECSTGCSLGRGHLTLLSRPTHTAMRPSG